MLKYKQLAKPELPIFLNYRQLALEPRAGIDCRFRQISLQALLPVVIHIRCYSPHIDIRSHRRDGRIGRIVPILADAAVFTVFDVKGVHDESLPFAYSFSKHYPLCHGIRDYRLLPAQKYHLFFV